MARVIAHIDLNAFFVRCEELRNPSLENKPVAVGKTGRGGIIATCSYTARKFGVRSGMPTFKALEICPKLIMINGHYTDYEVYSNEFIDYIKKYTKIIEKVSIDECYADFTEQIKNAKDPIQYFKDIQNGLFKKTGLKCSIGVAKTKFWAKMGSDLRKPMGLTIVKMKDVKSLFFDRPVGTYYGIGNKTAPKLEKIGIKTIGDLYNGLKDENSQVSTFFGHFRSDLLDHLEGRSSDIVEQREEIQDSISTRSTLPYDVNSQKVLKPYLLKVFDEVYDRFKELKKMAGGVTLSYRYTNLKTRTCATKLEKPSDDKNILLKAVLDNFEETYHDENVRQIGVIFYNLTDRYDTTIQMSLFDYEYYSEKDRTKDIVDELNRKMDSESGKLFIASDLLKKK